MGSRIILVMSQSDGTHDCGAAALNIAKNHRRQPHHAFKSTSPSFLKIHFNILYIRQK